MRQGFQLGIGGITPRSLEVGLDSAHLGCVQGEQPLPTQIDELDIAQAGQPDPLHTRLGFGRGRERRFERAIAAAALDRGVR